MPAMPQCAAMMQSDSATPTGASQRNEPCGGELSSAAEQLRRGVPVRGFRGPHSKTRSGRAA